MEYASKSTHCTDNMEENPDGLQPERQKLLDNAENPNISVDKGDQTNTSSSKDPGEKATSEETALTKNTEKTESRDLDSVNDADNSDEKKEEEEQSLGIGDWFSLITSCYSLVSYLLDVGTDIDLVIDYKRRGLTGYFWATLACIIIPHLLLTITDIEMLWEDRKLAKEAQRDEEEENNKAKEQEKSKGIEMTEGALQEQNQSTESTSLRNGDTNEVDDDIRKVGCFRLKLCATCDCTNDNRMYVCRIILGLLGLGIIVRKLQRLYYKFKGIKSRDQSLKSWYEAKTLEAQRDSSNLAFICAFTENCPQSLLQIYIFVQNPVPVYESIGRSIITSVLNLPLSYANYYRATRRQPKEEDTFEIRKDMDICGFIFYYLALLGAVVVRVLSIGLFTGLVSFQIGFIVLATHFVGNVLFIHFYQKPPFAGLAIGENKCSQYFSVAVNTMLYSLVNLFIFVDLNDRTHKKWRILTNNVLLYLENFTFAIVSFILAENEYAIIYAMIIGIGCVMHLIMLSNYYMFLHPEVGLCYNCVDKKEEPKPETKNQIDDAEVAITIETVG